MSSATSTESPAFRPGHAFAVATMVAASVAVMMTRDTRVENLVLLSLAVMAAGLAAMGFYRTLWPLVGEVREGKPAAVGGRTRLALEREKALVLRSIKELEFDRAMGKVADADFHEMVARLRARAIGLMKQLDEGGGAFRLEIEREVERRLAARSAGARGAAEPAAAPGRGAAAPGDDDTGEAPTPAGGTRVEGGALAMADEGTGRGARAAEGRGQASGAGSDIPELAAGSAAPAARACAGCGTRNDPDARFCKSCGARLDAAPSPWSAAH
jgi:hypothetical protein